MEKIEMKRRDFVKIVGLATGGLLLGCNVSADKVVVNTLENGISFVPNLFIQLQKDGTVTIVVARSEMGQGIRTSMASAIAEDLEADWKYVTVQQATGDAKFGNQNTDGSRSIRTLLKPMRKMGAMARSILEQAAAKKWNIAASDCKAENHFVVNNTTGEKVFFGDLVEDAKTIAIPSDENIILKDKKDFKYIGKKVVRGIDMEDFLHGKANYGLDARLPNMKFAAIARSPVTFGSIKSFDTSEATEITGVEQVVQLDRLIPPAGQFFGMLGGVAVIANNTWSAFQGKNNLNIEWESGSNKSYDTEKFKEKLISRIHNKAKVVPPFKGSVERAFNNADKVIEATYTMPHLAHAPMEVPNALAWVRDGKCDVWAPVQDPQTVRAEIAHFFGFALEDITINVMMLGGAFGRKSKSDFVVEAVALSQKIKVPVQVVWTREDDIQHSFYHAQNAQYLKGSLDENGKVTGWLHRVAFPSITSSFKPMSNYIAGFELGMGFTNNPYEIENVQIENAKAASHLRIGWLRSVSNIISGFGVNSFVDELAIASGKDAIEFRLDLLGKDKVSTAASPHPFNVARLKNVLIEAKKLSNWGKKLPKGHGLGVAIHYSFYSYVATVVEVSVKSEKVKVENIYSVLDCGMYVNRDAVINQMEGAAIFGMSLTMFGKISTKNGAVEQSNFHDYQMTRMIDAPNIHVHLVDNDEDPTGVGEPGVPPVSAAITNAIFNASGKRVRSLPLSDHGMV
ncbi:MAG: molybdopterin-dependent oxidoreductase [Flavobacteriaceae bacterium]|nr:molybdopterin-dependent oxidoreductase [Flavobacteriaceae bacterium]MDG2275984.1 molybdopterin-dependent oxidoreductase [Flavobacteriaceae bacterium]